MTDKGQNNDPPPKETSKKEVWIYFILYFFLSSFFFESSTKKSKQLIALDISKDYLVSYRIIESQRLSEAWKKRHFLNELNK